MKRTGYEINTVAIEVGILRRNQSGLPIPIFQWNLHIWWPKYRFSDYSLWLCRKSFNSFGISNALHPCQNFNLIYIAYSLLSYLCWWLSGLIYCRTTVHKTILLKQHYRHKYTMASVPNIQISSYSKSPRSVWFRL